MSGDSVKPASPHLATPVNTSAFVGTNPTDEQITSGLPVIRPERDKGFD